MRKLLKGTGKGEMRIGVLKDWEERMKGDVMKRAELWGSG